MRFVRTRLVQVLIDALIVCAALGVAYAIRFEGTPPGLYRKQFIVVLPYLVLLRLLVFGVFRVYRLVWRYVTARDLPRLVGATAAGTLALVGGRLFTVPVLGSAGLVINPTHTAVPWSVMVAEFTLTTMGIVGVRALWRLTAEEMRRKGHLVIDRPAEHRALLIGAGSAGVMVARELKSKPWSGVRVVGFVDDDRDKHGKIIHGLRVLGPTDGLPSFSRKLNADVAIITIGNASGQAVRRVVQLAEATSMKVQIIPEVNEILSGKVAISKFRDVVIEDLLRRDPVDLDAELIESFITGKDVLVTGAGGSIGSEICRQVCRFEPRSLVLLDQAENPLFHILNELREQYPATPLVPRVGSVTDGHGMRQVLAQLRPEVIFHAAAHKHVPLMEGNPAEAIRNNVGGSRIMADLADEFDVDAFVMISTDKAVNPTSVMGATKRLAEIYVQSLAARSKTRFTTVRFGNVLGSEGSVVPLFRKDIARGGPVRVTHPEMKRYFMTIPEASQLVLQAAAMGNGGEIFVLEMGEPIHIVDLARDLIRLSGYQLEQDIEIVYTGIRPGEKLSEEINLSEENATKTRHSRIWIGESQVTDLERTARMVDELLDSASDGEPNGLRRQLAALIPEYTPYSEERAPGDLAEPSPSMESGEERPAVGPDGAVQPSSA